MLALPLVKSSNPSFDISPIDLSSDIVVEKQIYYPCDDPTQPICRQFVNQGSCRRRKHCRFYHPTIITPVIKKRAARDLNHCYCGAHQKKLINKRSYHADEEDIPIFFAVCSRTGRSMKLCMA